jgi:UDP-glucose 4-epimerase
MLTIGITGGMGFIGSHVAKCAIDSGYNVLLLDHQRRPFSLGPQCEVFLGDVRDKTAVLEFAAHVDGIIHLAAVLGTQETIANPSPAIETNMLGGINILDASKQYNLPLVYAGVGNYWMLNTYSTTKTAIERLLYQYRNEFDCLFATVRPVNAYGPGQRPAPPFGPGKVRKIMPAFVCRAISGMPIEIYGDGTQVSDMVFVEDVARVFLKTWETLSKGIRVEHPVEVGPRESLTVNDVANEILMTVKGLGLNASTDPVHLPMRPGEKNRGDLSLKSLLDFESVARSLQDDDEQRVFLRKLRELGTRVTADVSTLSQVGLSDQDFIPFTIGCTQTVEWYVQNEGVAWTRP